MSQARRGAPRSEAARHAILDATTELFADRGWDHLTIEGIAAQAGVGKQTIYRWWPSKSALVAECLMEGRLLPEQFARGDSGDARADLVEWLDSLLTFVGEPGNSELVCSVLAAAAENEQVGHLLHAALGPSSLTDSVSAALADSAIGALVDAQEVTELLIGMVILHALQRRPATPGLAARLIGAILH